MESIKTNGNNSNIHVKELAQSSNKESGKLHIHTISSILSPSALNHSCPTNVIGVKFINREVNQAIVTLMIGSPVEQNNKNTKQGILAGYKEASELPDFAHVVLVPNQRSLTIASRNVSRYLLENPNSQIVPEETIKDSLMTDVGQKAESHNTNQDTQTGFSIPVGPHVKTYPY